MLVGFVPTQVGRYQKCNVRKVGEGMKRFFRDFKLLSTSPSHFLKLSLSHSVYLAFLSHSTQPSLSLSLCLLIFRPILLLCYPLPYLSLSGEAFHSCLFLCLCPFTIQSISCLLFVTFQLQLFMYSSLFFFSVIESTVFLHFALAFLSLCMSLHYVPSFLPHSLCLSLSLSLSLASSFTTTPHSYIFFPNFRCLFSHSFSSFLSFETVDNGWIEMVVCCSIQIKPNVQRNSCCRSNEHIAPADNNNNYLSFARK